MAEHENSNRGLSRRIFLKMAGAFGLWLSRPGLARALFTQRIPVRTKEKVTWTFDPTTGMLTGPGELNGPYRLRVDGLVEQPLVLSYADLRALPRVEQTSPIRCREGWYVADVPWAGFRFQEILKRVKPKPEAKFVVFYGLTAKPTDPPADDQYFESFHLAHLLNRKAEILMVLDLDGQPLPLEHGAPLRLIAPNDKPHRAIKYIGRIELTATQQMTFTSTVHGPGGVGVKSK